MQENGQIHKMALGCYGYGKWDADYWFIGPEQGMASHEDISRRVDVWTELGERELDDCRVFHERIGELRWHGAKPKLQKTWKQLMLLLMAHTGDCLDLRNPQDKQRLGVYQRDCWGREDGDTCVIELAGLPAHGCDESKKQKIDVFEPGQCEAIREQRIVTIRTRLLDHKPKLVIMYGFSEREHWESITAVISEKLPRGVALPVVAFTTHPVSFEGVSNAYWKKLAIELREVARWADSLGGGR
jgi:hypothetical protein